MPSYVWLIIIAAILALWYLWSKYSSLLNVDPASLHATQAISRYTTDIKGLIGAYEAQDAEGGSFMSRLGAFVGALPT